MVEPRLLIPGSIGCLSFQDVFVGTAKWYRGGLPQRTSSQPDGRAKIPLKSFDVPLFSRLIRRA